MTGVELIAAERARQVEFHDRTAEHDDGHDNYEMASAACCYAQPAFGGPYSHPTKGRAPTDWPWELEFWKPSPDQVRNLVKAGALIAAEIDRIQRK